MKTSSKFLINLIIVFVFCHHAEAQHVSPIQDRWTITASVVPDNNPRGNNYRNEIKLSVHKGINHYLETGLYLGHTNYFFIASDGKNVGIGNRLLTGLSVKAHLLPFVITAEDIRFDLYARSRIGISQLFGDPNPAAKNTFFQYCLGSGLAFYPTKKFGIFTEFGYDNKGLLGVQKWRLEYGFVFKFRRSQN